MLTRLLQGEYLCPGCKAGTRDLGKSLFKAKRGQMQTAREALLSGQGRIMAAKVVQLYRHVNSAGAQEMVYSADVRLYATPRDPSLGLDCTQVLCLSVILSALTAGLAALVSSLSRECRQQAQFTFIDSSVQDVLASIVTRSALSTNQAQQLLLESRPYVNTVVWLQHKVNEVFSEWGPVERISCAAFLRKALVSNKLNVKQKKVDKAGVSTDDILYCTQTLMAAKQVRLRLLCFTL